MPFERARHVGHPPSNRADVRLARFPNVYRPAADSMLLARSVVAAVGRIGVGAHALELCAGTGYASIHAARLGARVTAVDVDRRAVANIRLNARLNHVHIATLRADVRSLPLTRRYDLVFANPPYVPTEPTADEESGLAWNAGPDGRALLNPICRRAPDLVRPGGTLIIVQSDLAGTDTTGDLLRASGFTVSIESTIDIPFGPILSERVRYLVDAGLIAPDECTERVSAVVATLPVSVDGSGSKDDRPAAHELST